MSHPIHYPVLTSLGLTEAEALVYEILLENGPKTAHELVTLTELARGHLYNTLQSLKKRTLVTEDTTKAKTVFRAEDPACLHTLATTSLRTAQQVSAHLTAVLPTLTSAYNLSTHKPVVQIFEGLEGAEEAIADTLTVKSGIIRAFLDAAAITGTLKKANKKYVRQRLQAGITKRILAADTTKARAFFTSNPLEQTEVRFLSKLPDGFHSTMQLYGGNILYITLRETKMISVIMRDPDIARMHQEQFDWLWEKANV